MLKTALLTARTIERGSDQCIFTSVTPFSFSRKRIAISSRKLPWRTQMSYQEWRAKESSLLIRAHMHTFMPVSKNREFLGENLILSFWLGLPGSFSSLPRGPQSLFSRNNFIYDTERYLKRKRAQPGGKKWAAQLGIFKAPQYTSSSFSGQKFPFITFLQLNLSRVSFSLFPFFKHTHPRNKSSFSLIHVFN